MTMKTAVERRSKVVCECLGVTEAQVLQSIRTGQACSLAQIASCTQAGSGCTACHEGLRALLRREGKSCPSPSRV